MVSAVSPEVWIATVVGLLAILALDLFVIARRQRTVTVADATRWVVFYVALAIAFGVGLYLFGSETQRRGVLRRLHHRVQPEHRQPLRLRHHHVAVRRAAGGRRTRRCYIGIVLSLRDARGADRGGRRGYRGRELGLLLLRRVPDLHRDPARASSDDDEPDFGTTPSSAVSDG